MTIRPSFPSAAARESCEAGPSDPGLHTGLALAVLCTAQLMVVLGSSIVYIALPTIQTDLDFSRTGLGWVVNSYTLAYGSLMLLGGRAGDLFGRRTMFLTGIVLFTVASLVGGLSPDRTWLLASRTVQGVGAAIISPCTLALIANTFPEGGKRNRALGVYAAVSGAGAAIGLIAGGMLTEWFTWRWVFFVNIPIGLALVSMARWVPRGRSHHSGRLDVGGALTATAGLTALVYGLVRVSTDDWDDATALALFGATAALLTLFVVIELLVPDPLVPLRIFASRARSGSYVVMLLTAGSMFSMFFFLTQFLQEVEHFGPLKAGFAFLPMSVAIILTAQLTSHVIGRSGPVPPLLLGQVLLGVGLFLISGIAIGTDYQTRILPALIIAGLGLGGIFVCLTTTSLAGVPDHEAGLASGLLATSQQLGATLGLAVLVTVSTHSTQDRLRDMGAGPINPMDALVHGWAQAFSVATVFPVIAFGIVAAVVRRPGAVTAGTPSGEETGIQGRGKHSSHRR